MSRDVLLKRVREALTLPAPHPGEHLGTDHRHAPVESGENVQQWLPLVGPTYGDRVRLFEQCSTALTTNFQVFPNTGLALAYMQTMARDYGWKRIGTHRAALTDAAVETLGLPTLVTDGGYDVSGLEQVDVGITTCEALIAQTGSVLVTNRANGDRALSVLPPHHVVLARKE